MDIPIDVFGKLFAIYDQEESLAKLKKEIFKTLMENKIESGQSNVLDCDELSQTENNKSELFDIEKPKQKKLGLGHLVAVCYQDVGGSKKIFPEVQVLFKSVTGKTRNGGVSPLSMKKYLNDNRLPSQKEIKRLYRNKAGTGINGVPVEWVEIENM